MAGSEIRSNRKNKVQSPSKLQPLSVAIIALLYCFSNRVRKARFLKFVLTFIISLGDLPNSSNINMGGLTKNEQTEVKCYREKI